MNQLITKKVSLIKGIFITFHIKLALMSAVYPFHHLAACPSVPGTRNGLQQSHVPE